METNSFSDSLLCKPNVLRFKCLQVLDSHFSPLLQKHINNLFSSYSLCVNVSLSIFQSDVWSAIEECQVFNKEAHYLR